MNTIKRLCLGSAVLLLSSNGWAQTLFTFGEHSVSEKEFVSVYQKNNQPGNPNSVSAKEYLNLYALFKMKVQEALDSHLDTTRAVKAELESYKTQLANSELMDKTVTDRLVKEVYDRMKSSPRVSHILITVHSGQNEARAKAKADSIYQLLQQGKADFDRLAETLSDDRSTSVKGGDLGYISPLQTPYKFESVAYQTPVNQVSEPFRTKFGYHLLKVTDKEKDPGKIQVAQILIAIPNVKDKGQRDAALATAREVEQKLKHGDDFASLVANYSDDKFTNKTAGLMPAFGRGEMTPEFEAAAFALPKVGAISQPVLTEYGYHILKLVNKEPLPSFEEVRDQIVNDIQKDDREKEARTAYLQHIKDSYGFKEYPQQFEKLVGLVQSQESKSFAPENYGKLDEILFEVHGTKYSEKDYLQYIYKLTRDNYVGKKENVVKDLYSGYQNKVIRDWQQKELFDNNPKLQHLLEEYRDGILLFSLLDKKVWSQATQDSVGLKAYFEANRQNYKWEPGFDGASFHSNNRALLEQLSTSLKQGEDVQVALKELNLGEALDQNIHYSEGRYPFSVVPFDLEKLEAHKASPIFKMEDSDQYAMFFVNELYPKESLKSFDEAKGFVMADFQSSLERDWEKSLEARYPLKINEKVYDKMSRKLK